MVKICVDCRYIRERPSGISTLVQALVDYLPAMAPDYRFLFLKHPKAPGRLSIEPNVEERIVKQEANGLATLMYLPRVVDLSDVDLFHATYNILPAGLKMPTVVTLCDVMWLKHPYWARQPGLWGFVETAFYQHGIRSALANATRIMAISEETKREIGTLDRAAEGRTRVALEGIAPEFRALESDAGRALIESARVRWLKSASRYILTIGQFSGYKNHERVVRAFAQAFPEQRDVHLALIQRLGPGAKTLRPIARELGISERVHFLSGVPFDDLIALINGATALCHPSLYEGFGNPPAEAMACGCPVVTSNCSSMPEVSGDAALLVNPESVDDIARALRTVAQDSELADSMRQRGLRRAKELSWKIFAAKNLEVYREVLGQ